ncbi:unnamed protein product [Strongylus vulgaris]|uniref:Uncharacterized protein n=1 Tax=Strongylus vulgaris TaxID=40348 RepID=A0A3P7JPY1_STRVU|nr:unnamed protein product [Strongylus vulgaris]
MDEEMDIDVVADENGQQVNATPETANRVVEEPLDEEEDDRTYSGSSNGSSFGEDEDGAPMVSMRKKVYFLNIFHPVATVQVLYCFRILMRHQQCALHLWNYPLILD